MRSERRAQEYTSFVLHSSELTEQHRTENRRWDLLNADEFGGELGTPRKIVAGQGTDPEHRNAVAHRGYYQRPQVDTPTVLDLPQGYYEARIAMNRRQRGA